VAAGGMVQPGGDCGQWARAVNMTCQGATAAAAAAARRRSGAAGLSSQTVTTVQASAWMVPAARAVPAPAPGRTRKPPGRAGPLAAASDRHPA
jgi:hypothetical protein